MVSMYLINQAADRVWTQCSNGKKLLHIKSGRLNGQCEYGSNRPTTTHQQLTKYFEILFSEFVTINKRKPA